MTVGLCMDIVEIGLATHLRYIYDHAPAIQTDRIATRTTKGGLRPNHARLRSKAYNLVWGHTQTMQSTTVIMCNRYC